MSTVEDRLRLEKFDLSTKIKKAREFRLTQDWVDLPVTEKCLLDTQISIMETYREVLTNRIVLLKTRELEQINKKPKEKDDKFSKIVNEFIDKLDEFFEEGEE